MFPASAKQDLVSDLWTFLVTFVKDRPGHDWRYAIDASKMANDFKWEPLESFETGIRKYVQWSLENIH